MRKDCKIDNRKVFCHNASTLGFTHGYYCKRGAMVLYKEGLDGQYQIGRSLGRITALETIEDIHGTKRVVEKNYILMAQLSSDATHVYERWIDPALVYRIYDSPKNLAEWFFTDGPTRYDVETTRRLMEHGTISESHIHLVEKRVATFAARDNGTWTPEMEVESFRP